MIIVVFLLLLTSIPSGYSKTPKQEDDFMPLIQRVRLNTHKFEDTYKSRKMPGFKGVPTEIDWSNVVAIITTYNEEKSNALLPAIYKTWATHLGDGADILLVTDKDDNRKDEEILPSEYANAIKAKVHIHRSNAKKEGSRLRYKIMDSFNQAYQLFGRNIEKQIYLKIDADSYVIAENLMGLMDSIHKETYPTSVQFGRTACVPACYATGGLYGFSRSGLRAMLNYVRKNPGLYEHEYFMMAHEDYFTSHAFRQATNGTSPIIYVLGGLAEELNRYFRFSKNFSYNRNNIKNPFFYSVHSVKTPEDFYSLHERFYDENGNLKEIVYDQLGIVE